MIRIKEGVKLQGKRKTPKGKTVKVRMCPELNFLLIVAEYEYRKQSAELVITSVFDGKHMRQSKHYRGQAVDLRIWNLQDPKLAANQIQKRVGPSYQVILESDHIHAEYDPPASEYAEVE